MHARSDSDGQKCFRTGSAGKRGKNRIWNEAGWQLITKLIANVKRLSTDTLHAMRSELRDDDDEKLVRKHKQVCPFLVLEMLTGVN